MAIEEYKEKLKEKWQEFFFCQSEEQPGEKVKNKKHIAMAVAGLCLVVLLAAFGILKTSYAVTDMAAAQGDDRVLVRITPGMGSSQIGELLAENGVVDSSAKFWLTVKLNGADSKFQAGTFEMERNMSPGDALGILLNGHSTATRITIPEGLSVREVAKLLSQAGLVDEEEFLAEAKTFAPYEYIEEVPEADYRIEGFLFPDTYEFATDATAQDIMQRMADEFDKKLTEEMRQQAAEKNLSIYELVTMASLVEKEARFPEDRPIIAQVFFKRMEIGMPLQTDTTIQYLLAEAKEDLSYSDTEIESPYNTYQNYGLPPGPIASPGLASLEAVLQPADTDYLYFVADRQGHNHYGYTYDEHLALTDQVR